MQAGDRIYLFSDGYLDQFNGTTQRKFSKKRFKELLIKINNLPMAEQKEILQTTLLDWRGEQAQIDDVTVIGFEWK